MHCLCFPLRFVAVIFVVLVSQLVNAADRPGSPEAFRRWAILASAEVRDIGVSDLLTAELSRKSFELVEREQLEAVSKELELAMLFGADGAASRLRVGKTLKADALVLVTLVNQDAKKSVKLVVCECRYGSRLKLEQFEFEAERLDQVVANITAEVERTRAKFARGVEQIIAVSPFLSKSLTHEFDHLQFGLAGLLGQALNEQPGTAVLEIEEARAIGAELARTGGEIKDRIVPTFVEAEFVVPELARAVEASKITLDLLIKASGGRTGSWKQEKLKQSEAVAWLTGDVAAGILKSAVTKTKLSRDQQRRALLQRAENFSRLGAFPEAIAMRESALLLYDPFDERLRLLTDYFHGTWTQRDHNNRESLKAMKPNPKGGGFVPTEESHRLRTVHEAEMKQLCRRGRQLIEVMLANREVNLVEGSLLWTHGQAVFGNDSRFFWDCIPRLHQLNPNLRRGQPLDEVRRATKVTRDFWGPSPAAQSKLWSNLAVSTARHVSKPMIARHGEYDFAQGFRDVERLVTQCHHPRWPIPSLVAAAMPDRMGLAQITSGDGENLHFVKVWKIDPGELAKHYNRLIESKQPWAEFYGRCGLWGEAIRTQSQSKSEINVEFESLQKFLTTWRKRYPDSEALVAEIDLILTTVRNANDNRTPESVAANKPPAPPSKERQPVPSDKVQPATSDLPIARFEPVGDTPTPFEVVTNCGDKLDAVWNSDHLWLMPVGGELKLIFERPKLAMKYSRDFLHDVHFDGRWLWVVTAESGLRVFDLNGRMLGHLPAPHALATVATAKSSKENSPDSDTLIADATQLPPFDPKPYPLHNEPFDGVATRTAASLKILPFGEGRCVVAANYGPLHRLWIAVVTLKPTGSWEVKIVQQGTKVPQVGDAQQFQHADIATEATWLTRFEKPQPIPRPLAILGRKISPFHSNQVPPLAIDLTSLKVSALPGNFREDGAFWLPVVAANGRLIQNTSHLFETIEPIFLKPDAPWKSELFIASPKRDNTISVQGRFIVDGDNVLVVTYHGWARLNTQTWKFDLFGPRPLPKQHRFAYQGSSAHHGLVAWNRNSPLHRVILNEESSNPLPETKP